METEQEKIDYDLDLIELEETYNRFCKLVYKKNELKEDANMRFGYDESIYVDWLLTNKIEQILKQDKKTYVDDRIYIRFFYKEFLYFGVEMFQDYML